MTLFNTKYRIMQTGTRMLLVLQHAVLKQQLDISQLSEDRLVEALQP